MSDSESIHPFETLCRRALAGHLQPVKRPHVSFEDVGGADSRNAGQPGRSVASVVGMVSGTTINADFLTRLGDEKTEAGITFLRNKKIQCRRPDGYSGRTIL